MTRNEREHYREIAEREIYGEFPPPGPGIDAAGERRYLNSRIKINTRMLELYIEDKIDDVENRIENILNARRY